MNKKMKASTVVFLITSLLILVNIALMVYQFTHVVISVWNIVPTVILIFIFFGNLINMFGIKLPGSLGALSQFGAPQTSEKEQNAYRENEDFYALNTSFPTKLKARTIVFKGVFLILFVALTFMFSGFAARVEYDQVVSGTIIEKTVLGGVSTSVDFYDGDVSSHDDRSLKMIVSYDVNGQIYRAQVVDKFSHKRDNNFMDVCVKNDGTFVCAYDNIISYKVMSCACLVLAILTFLGFVFRLPNVDLIMFVIGFVGIGIVALMNSFNWADWLLKDFTVFGGCFVTICVMCSLQLIMLRIIHTIGKRRYSNFKLS